MSTKKIYNEKFHKALQHEPQSVPPIWFMRQAGRYHQHYQELKKKHTFMELCKQPDLAAEVTMGPIDDFDFDVAILFSDLLFPLEVLGLGLDYKPGPVLEWHLNEDNFSKLNRWQDHIDKLEFQKDAVIKIRERLPDNKSLIGFVGGPWTLFTYAVEGKHAGGLIGPKNKLGLFKKFCEIMIPLLKRNIEMQFEGGAEVVMVFDTAAGELDSHTFTQTVAPELEKMIGDFPKKLGYYAKGTVPGHYQHNTFSSQKWAGFGFDHRWDIKERMKTGFCQNGFVQGNFDQSFLFAETNNFEELAMRYLEPIAKLTPEERAGWVCGLGHGVLPKTPEANVRKFIQLAREVFS